MDWMLAILKPRWGRGGGQLIVAIAKDPNEKYFPLAVAVVEAKVKNS